ncbi:calcitonin gene-related peptide type 1 receptor-like isoform X1 [Pecten maximus]|uniref:calcitonin gene-related peptide type 1 receptor-like isoform X1 n=1 Tax=Pecten maximus TaxID=6579 RepID=UPI0014582F59|nr:calcitonin gene-related peptide type 1 receptor-like isoform X1 [Pecten maximus]
MPGNDSLSKSNHLQDLLNASFLKCLREVLSQPYPNDGEQYCNATSDIFGCWNYTQAGTTAIIPCPEIPGMNPNEYAFKQCTENGTWWRSPSTNKEKSDYSYCWKDIHTFIENTNSGHEHVYIFVSGYSISVAMLLLSLFIFCRFSQLRCDRITIHKNLFSSYVLTGFSWILYMLLVATNGHVIQENPIWCRMIHVFAQYCVVSNFSWMFCEGLYLHTIMVRTFGSTKHVLIACYFIGWLWPFVLVSIYTGIRGSADDDQRSSCWIGESSLQWIMYAPIIVSMVANFIFLCNIVRLLITKLRQVPEATQTNDELHSECAFFMALKTQMNTEGSNVNIEEVDRFKKAARATLILIPLLGLQFLLVPLRPEIGSDTERAYHYISALVVSLQGAFVSTMYCFCNSEVISVIKRKWYQHKVMFSGKRSRTSSTIAATTYTFVDHVSTVQTSIT